MKRRAFLRRLNFEMFWRGFDRGARVEALADFEGLLADGALLGDPASVACELALETPPSPTFRAFLAARVGVVRALGCALIFFGAWWASVGHPWANFKDYNLAGLLAGILVMGGAFALAVYPRVRRVDYGGLRGLGGVVNVCCGILVVVWGLLMYSRVGMDLLTRVALVGVELPRPFYTPVNAFADLSVWVCLGCFVLAGFRAWVGRGEWFVTAFFALAAYFFVAAHVNFLGHMDAVYSPPVFGAPLLVLVVGALLGLVAWFALRRRFGRGVA